MTLELFSSVSTIESNPGPGQYNIDPYRTIGGPLSLKYSIKANSKTSFQIPDTDTSKVDFMPFKKTSDSLPRYCTISRRYATLQPYVNDVGPSYLPNSEVNRPARITIKSRYTPKDNSSSPGPGTYFPKDLPRTQFPPMLARPPIVLSDASCSPGPGAYNVSRDIGENSHKFSIRPITAPVEEEVESPGYKYNNPLCLGDDQPKFSLSRSVNSDFCNDGTPGPGAYQPKDVVSFDISGSIHGRIPPAKVHVNDVPYEDTRVFPNDKRPATIHKRCGRQYFSYDESVPGPNFFPESSMNNGRKHFLGKKEVPPVKEVSQTPGPCSYNLLNQTRSSVPSFSMKGPIVRDEWLPKEKSAPGPGQYNVRSENTLPRWTIGQRSISQARKRAMNDVKVQRARTAAALKRNNQEVDVKRNERLEKTSLL